MNNPHLQDKMKAIKTKIEQLIEKGMLDEARSALDQYDSKIPGDPDICSIRAVVSIMEGSLEEAEAILVKGLEKDTVQFDLLFNLAYIYELTGQYQKAADLYGKAFTVAYSYEHKQSVKDAVERIKGANSNLVFVDRAKIVFFVKTGMNTFFEDIINGLSNDYWVRKITVTDFKQIDDGMEWANICWFEWCDDLVIYGSRLPLAQQKKIICRLHSYEAFTNYIYEVAWENVEKVIFVAEHIRDYVLSKLSKIRAEQTAVIPNGIDLDRYAFKNRSKGFNVAYVGYINYKKGPMLLLHTFKALYDYDNRYKLYIAGEFQDGRDELYFNQMIKEFDIKDNVIYDGWQENVDIWLEDKNYILCTSVLESQNMSVMQAMCKGIKPVVHNFVGARGIYSDDYIWNTIDEAVESIRNESYNSQEYRSFIDGNYSLCDNLNKIRDLVQNITNSSEITYSNVITEDPPKPLVTVGIINYNCKQYLNNCVQSFINQTYPNIEILLIDDFSTDGSREIVEQLESEHENIRAIYHASNSGGATKGIQEIFSEARGKYVQWIASDDYVTKDAIKHFVEYMEHNPDKDYVYCNFNIVNEDNISTGQWIYDLIEPSMVVRRIFGTQSGLIPMNCLFRLEFFRSKNLQWIVYKENDFSADTLNSLAFIKAGINYGLINQSYINYRVHSQNASHNLRKRVVTSATIIDYVIKNFSEEIYFPDIDWEKQTNRAQYKNLILAQFYYEQIIGNLSFKSIPAYIRHNTSEDEMLEYVAVFIKEGLSYIAEGLKQGNTYKNQLEELKEMFSEIRRQKYHYASISETPVISIGIYTYNRAERLEKCLHSIFSQIGNDRRFEVVVSDNSSSDRTAEVVSKYMSGFNNLRYNRNDINVGSEENLYIVLDQLKGEYLFPHGDDDYFKDGTLYELLDLVENNRNCSLFYINVLHDDKSSFKFNGMSEYLKQASIYSTFVSSFIIKKSDFDKLTDKRKYMGSYIPHVYWIYGVLEINPVFFMYCSKIYNQEEDQSPGGYIYSFARTMIKSYFDILSFYIGKGISLQDITHEKRELVERTLWYYEMGLKKKDDKFLEDFESIFVEYYKNESYFDEAYRKFLEIKRGYINIS